MPTKKKKHVVILGGGFAGVIAAKTLARKNVSHVSITLIDKNDYHAYPIDFYEVATALSRQTAVDDVQINFSKLRSSSAIPFSRLFADTSVEHMKGTIEHIDMEKQCVRLSGKRMITYDYLILALGSETNFFSIPHLEEHALQFKSLDDALNVRSETEELFLSIPKHEMIRVAIAGGGYSGCELAGELIAYMKRLAHTHGHPIENISCILVEASPALLGRSSAWVQEHALKHLRSIGVDVRLNTVIQDVSPKEIIAKNDARIPYNLLVWTAGIVPNRITETLTGVPQEKACIVVDEKLRIGMHDNVYVVGDIAYCVDSATNERIPATAYNAIAQGKRAAKNIILREEGREEVPYVPQMPSYIVSFGSKYVIAELKSGFIQFSGYGAWILKHLVTLRYFMQILPWGDAWRLWRGNMITYVKNDD